MSQPCAPSPYCPSRRAPGGGFGFAAQDLRPADATVLVGVTATDPGVYVYPTARPGATVPVPNATNTAILGYAHSVSDCADSGGTNVTVNPAAGPAPVVNVSSAPAVVNVAPAVNVSATAPTVTVNVPTPGPSATQLFEFPDGSVRLLDSTGAISVVQAAPAVPAVPPCPSVRVASGGFLFHPADIQDPAATVLIEDCDGVFVGKGYPTAGVGHTVELWSCDPTPVLLGYAANQSDCAAPCPCSSTTASTTPGTPGQSAYQLAVAAGYAGTEAQWLASLQGANGASAYQSAVAGGYVGTEAQWLASLQGTAGQSAYQAAVANGFVGTEAQWLASLQGGTGPGMLTASAYNSYGQLTSATIDGVNYVYTYNAVGQLATVTVGATTYTYTYNPDGTVSTVV